jgi:hypothetical protein
MPRYYFDVRCDSGSWSPDQNGIDLAGRDDARAEALKRLVKSAEELLHDHWQTEVRVRDEQTEPVLTFTLSLRAAERS